MVMNSLKILSLNCRRFERQEKLTNIKYFCELHSADVCCFQEAFIPNILKVFSHDYQVYVNFDKNQQIGVAVLIKKHLKIFDFAMCNQG